MKFAAKNATVAAKYATADQNLVLDTLLVPGASLKNNDVRSTFLSELKKNPATIIMNNPTNVVPMIV